MNKQEYTNIINSVVDDIHKRFLELKDNDDPEKIFVDTCRKHLFIHLQKDFNTARELFYHIREKHENYTILHGFFEDVINFYENSLEKENENV